MYNTKTKKIFLFMQLQVNRVCLTQLGNSQGTKSLLKLVYEFKDLNS